MRQISVICQKCRHTELVMITGSMIGPVVNPTKCSACGAHLVFDTDELLRAADDHPFKRY